LRIFTVNKCTYSQLIRLLLIIRAFTVDKSTASVGQEPSVSEVL